MSDRERFQFVGRHPDANGVPWLIWASNGPSVYWAVVERLFWDNTRNMAAYWELSRGHHYEPGEDMQVIKRVAGAGQ